jgi:hypothetical protein
VTCYNARRKSNIRHCSRGVGSASWKCVVLQCSLTNTVSRPKIMYYFPTKFFHYFIYHHIPIWNYHAHYYHILLMPYYKYYYFPYCYVIIAVICHQITTIAVSLSRALEISTNIVALSHTIILILTSRTVLLFNCYVILSHSFIIGAWIRQSGYRLNCGLNDWGIVGSIAARGKKYFSNFEKFRSALGPKQPVVKAYQRLSPEGKGSQIWTWPFTSL